MTDETENTDSHEPDGVVIIHHPADGGEWYGIGPFPPMQDLVVMLLADKACTCRVEALWVRFPKGIVMAVKPPPEVQEAMKAIIKDVLNMNEPEPEEEPPIIH